MLERLGHLLIRRRTAIFALSLIAMLIMGAVGSLLFSRLQSGGYNNPQSDSAKVWQLLDKTFEIRAPEVVLVVDSPQGNVESSAAEASALEAEILKTKNVKKTLSYWSSGKSPELKSKDGKAGYILVYLDASKKVEIDATSASIQQKFDGVRGNLRIYVSGFGVFSSSVNTTIAEDLIKSESFAIPITFILLLIVFGSLTASAMPLVVGFFAILGAFFAVYLISLTTDVSIFALNLITGLGLGLGIDYALLIVNRFREELHAGRSVEESIVRTVNSAGRTVFFSGLTVAVTLGSLMVFPQYFLKSFGYAGLTTVIMAVLGALIPLPALLAILGHKVDKLVVRKSSITPKVDGYWSKIARFVMHRPIRVIVATLFILTFMIAPIRGALFSQVDERVLPANSKTAIAAAIVADRFAGAYTSPIELIFDQTSVNKIPAYLEKVVQDPHIVTLLPTTSAGTKIRVAAISNLAPRTPAAAKEIQDLRQIPAPAGTLIGGVAADYADSQGGIKAKLPIIFLWVTLSVLLLLFLFTGSIILPIKAVLLNVISLSATMGVITWIFIGGHLGWLVGSFTKTGSLDTSIVVLIVVTTFGLSMDYEVFLLSRIKEEHDAGMGTIDSVATGLQRSARIITAAAALLAIVFASFILSGVTSIKMLGFGVAFAILLDATVVRALLVPALMRLLSERNWWAPTFLKRFVIKH